MAHAALPGLLPTPPKRTMLPLLPAAPCAVILPSSPLRRPSRADAAGRWDAHKTKPAGSPASSSSSSSSSSCGQNSFGSNKKIVTLTSSSGRTSPASSSRADSEERWDAHKKPASPASTSASSSSAISNKTKTCRVCRHPNGQRSSSSAERWDAQKKPARAPQRAEELEDGESSTGSNDVELFMPRDQPPPRSFYAGPGFITSPEPSMLPKPSFMVRVA
ncbi:hypothetical protein PVAP13_8NG053400 [Panicum virgatum]|uniref:Uncharacterized protein n=2 Tax=Panicum virgatum TaxID=38727 RepID=A0A8T0P5A0_PANVG|nr:hypothetical protein PVAP13_8NG053400 [Panicum virgatum]